MIEMLLLVIVSLCFVPWSDAAPVPWKTVDLTHVMNERSQKYPIFKNFSMTVQWNETRPEVNNNWLQLEEFVSSSHTGTHMDAPSHFVPGALNIDQIPIEQFIGPAAVIDITEKAKENPDVRVTVEDLTNWESRTGRSLDGTIVLQNSGWASKYWDTAEYIGNADWDPKRMVFPGFDPEAADWLVANRHIKGLGVDTLSFDRGTSSEFLSHRKILGHGIYGLENVANLEQIPIAGAMLHVVPIKMARASGSPARIIATFPEIIAPHSS